MGSQAMFAGSTAGRSDPAHVLRAYEADYTPVGVAVAWTLALARECRLASPFVEHDHSLGVPLAPSTILDPSAGSGVFGRVCRVVFPGARLIAVEPRASEVGLGEAYDEVHVCELAEYLDGKPARPDLILTNPPFSGFGTKKSRPWWELLHAAGMVGEETTVGLVGLSQWGQAQRAAPVLRRWSPSRQIRVCGRVSYRGDGSADMREYSLWVFDGHAVGFHRARGLSPRWACVQLPQLSPGLMSWEPSAVPGTYPVDPALVEQIAGVL